MDSHRKTVMMCGDNAAFLHALAALVDDVDVAIGEKPKLDGSDPDLVVWAVGSDELPEDASKVAQMVPTLFLADEALFLAAVDLGARGFLGAEVSLDRVRDAITTILEGGAVVPPDLLGTLLRHVVDRRRRASERTQALGTLTARESEVFELAASGARKDEIARRLFISPDTARTHLQRVYRKMGVNSQAELIAIGYESDGQVNGAVE